MLSLSNYLEEILWKNQIQSLPYKRFIICIKRTYLQNRYLITSRGVGKEKKSLAKVLPSQIIKSFGINPQSIFSLLKVCGKDDLHLKVIREENLVDKEDTRKEMHVDAGIIL